MFSSLSVGTDECCMISDTRETIARNSETYSVFDGADILYMYLRLALCVLNVESRRRRTGFAWLML